MFIDPLATRFRDEAELVGLCDPNPARLAYYVQRLAGPLAYPQNVPTYPATDFDRMIQQTRPDVVLVCTVDAYHHDYIIRAMDLGCDVITEKPLTIDAEKCRAIYDAIKRTGRKLRVTFNARWQPGSMLVKRLLNDGVIGDVLHVDMDYMLNTSHGADYFRRWHREKDKSGGLLVHKATHHFDLINWWIDAVPEQVFGFGRLAFYGRENARKRGEQVRYDRYRGHDTDKDPFAFDLTAVERDRLLYAEAEQHDGYIRDRNVFGDNITIEDSMSVLVKYRTGVTLNYSLNTYLPREGYHVAFNGTRGRLDYFDERETHVVPDAAPPLAGPEHHWQSACIVHPIFGKAYRVEIPVAEGGHGGGDPRLQEQLFAATPPPDLLGGAAQHGQGAASALIGIATNASFITNAPVRIHDLCPALGDARYLHDLP